jgi:predicted small lipoprotein YifL
VNRRRALRALLALALLAAPPLLLTGCGRSGPPRPPGPREAITYPRNYPAPEPPATPAPAPRP